jgi:hypothetical protein
LPSVLISFPSELGGANRAEPAFDFGWISFIHVEEMRHNRRNDRFALVIRRHRDNAAEDFKRSAVPVLTHIVQGSEAGVDEGAQIFADLFAPIPFCDTEPASGIFGEAIEASPEGFIIDLFPEGKQPRGGAVFVMDKFIVVFSSAGVACASTSISGELDPETITSEVIDGATDRGCGDRFPCFGMLSDRMVRSSKGGIRTRRSAGVGSASDNFGTNASLLLQELLARACSCSE